MLYERELDCVGVGSVRFFPGGNVKWGSATDALCCVPFGQFRQQNRRAPPINHPVTWSLLVTNKRASLWPQSGLMVSGQWTLLLRS